MTRGHRHARGVDPATPRVRPRIVLNDPALSASQPDGRPGRVGRQRARPRDRGPADAAGVAGARARRPRGGAPARATRTTATRSRSARCWRATSSTPPATACTTCSPRRSRASPACGTATRTRRCCRTRPSPCAERAPDALAALDAAAGIEMEALARRLAHHAGAQQLRDLGVTEDALETCVREVAQARPAISRARRPPPARRRSAPSTRRPTDGSMLDLLTDLMGAADGRCAYAEARHVDARSEALAVRQRRHRRHRQLRRRRASACACGSAAAGASPPRATSRAPGPQAALARALAVAEAQPAAPATAAGAGRPARSGTGPRRTSSTRSPSPLEDKLELLLRRRGAPCAPATSAWCARPRPARAWRERKAFASTEGAALHPGDRSPAARGIAAYATRRQRPAGALLPDRPRRRPERRRRLGARRSASTSPATRRAWPRRRSRCSSAPPCPQGDEHDRPARRAGGAAGPRVDRARARARPHPARRGVLRRARAGWRRATSARCATAPSW